MSAQPTNPTADDNHIPGPRKRQARLDDNGEPVILPASKKRKSAEQNGQKKKVPAKKRPDNKRTVSKTVSVAPEKPSVEIEDSDNPRNTPKDADTSNPQVPEVVQVESSGSEFDDDETDVVMPKKKASVMEEPEEDDEAELGPYLFSNKMVSC